MPSFMLPGRTACRCMVLLLAALASVPGFVSPAQGQSVIDWQSLRDGDIVLIRHAYVAGSGEAVVVRPEGAALRVLGSLPLP